MKLPTKEEIEKFLKEFEVPPNIIDHTRKVTKICVFLANELSKKGEKINIEMLEVASLLHDLDKLKSSFEKNDHGQIAYDFLKQRGFDEEFADLIKYHRGESIYPKEMGWEIKILRYADLRFIGDKLVTIYERMDDLKVRYPWFAKPENSDPIIKMTKSIEQDIFSKLDFLPEDLDAEMNKGTIKITYFVHGTTTDNEAGIATGWHHGKLSELGIKQSAELKAMISDKKFDVVFCSDLQRAIDSAKFVFGSLILEDNIKIDKRLRECNYGDMNGAPSEKVEAYDCISNRFPNGESYLDVEQRMKSFLKDILKKYPNKNIAIVAHKATQLALDVILKSKTWQQAVAEDWRKKKEWMPGWEYVL